ncbi:uncharacterized protein LOC62_02G001786 [Vanrija pseudolonga]|uniref:Uncharacterized protein n=1 Tax=Vanrija pseudolonga TaxID=143232 RepID=A0AAF0Y1G0_9TREE|nr:hypothetical protein LOC62_02G001786 [Vanrija pseudolonga]
MATKVQGRHIVSVLEDPAASETPTFVTPFGSDTPRMAWQPNADDDLDSDFDEESDYEDSDDEPRRKKSRKAAKAKRNSKAKLKTELAAGKRLLGRARILDIHGYQGNRYEEFETALENALAKVETLRVFDTSHLAIYVRPPRTIIFFGRPGSYISPRTSKLVYHYPGTEDEVKEAQLPDWEPTYPPDDPIEWVYLLLQGSTPDKVYAPGYRGNDGLVQDAIRLDETYEGPPAARDSHTFVGGRKLILSALGLKIDATDEELAAATRSAPSVRFLTPEEYEAEVGEEQFVLETQEDPYHGARAVFHS